MPRILLVKTSSLGDVVHNLPVASDIHSRIAGAEIHWVLEEPFAAIARLHPAVQRVIPAAVRRWRKSWWRVKTRQEIRELFAELRAVPYDAVIDTQGLLKSALIARAASGTRYGAGWRNAREPSFLFYDRTFRVPSGLHAVERNRSLAAQALGYTTPAGVDYGIRAERKSFPWLMTDRYAVLLHATSAREKLWPEERWVTLGNAFHARGLRTVLPWGSTEERSRSERLATAISGALVPPGLVLSDLTSVLSAALFVIGVDTGLTHLAGALGVATVGIFSSTDPASTGLFGCARAANVGHIGASPVADEVLRALERLSA